MEVNGVLAGRVRGLDEHLVATSKLGARAASDRHRTLR
jgi:hypothetical protein